MTIFIERLKEIGNSQVVVNPDVEEEVTGEKIDALKPVVVTSVTLGKELHAGHLFLLTVADLVRTNLGSQEPVILINNNTGPRAAGAVVSLSQKLEISLEEAAKLMSSNTLGVPDITDSYRSRVESGADLERATVILDQIGVDIFSPITNLVRSKLAESGFQVKIVSESSLIEKGHKDVETASSKWNGTGFISLPIKKGVKILKQGGLLTATGKSVSSLISLSKGLEMEGSKPLFIFVDSLPDTTDTVSIFSSLGKFGKALQIPGAGIGFNEKMASGTKGEALTISQLTNLFKQKCPNGSLLLALKYMVLTQPIFMQTNPPNLNDSTFDFKDNEAFVGALVKSYSEFLSFREEIRTLLLKLQSKLGEETKISDEKTRKWMDFLPLKAKSLLETKGNEALGSIKNISVVKDKNKLIEYLMAAGYNQEEAEKKAQRFIKGQKGLAIRGNHFLGILKMLTVTEKNIISLSPTDFKTIILMASFCLERLGYES